MLSSPLLGRTVPRLVKNAIVRQGRAVLYKSAKFDSLRMMPTIVNQKSWLSTVAVKASYSPENNKSSQKSEGPSPTPITTTVKSEPGFVSKKLRVLNMKTVKAIMEELRAVDQNSDERIDSVELQHLMRKHNNAFTEEEIIQIGELFYAGKSGGSVSFDKFIEAIDRVIEMEERRDVDKDSANPLGIGTCGNEYLFYKNHANLDWNIELTHVAPVNFRDKLAFGASKALRLVFDAATGWNGEITKEKVMNRTIFLETVAAVPGMVAAIVRHFKSLRTFQRDGGMMQMFLDEANNERMHLLTFVRMKDPNLFFRFMVIGGQFVFGSAFLVSYIISPKFCHRFVGYIEEEACHTYTKIIKAIEEADDNHELAVWRTQLAPSIGRSYWHLGEGGTVRDLFYAIRADEAEHRDVNHMCSSMEDGIQNPVSNTEEKLNTMLLKYAHDLLDRTQETKEKVEKTL